MIKHIIEAFPGERIPPVGDFYNRMASWRNIFKGNPSWDKVKKSGLYQRGDRRMNLLNTAKVLCDTFSTQCFAEQVEITCDIAEYKDWLDSIMEQESFWDNIPQLLSKAFSIGGCVLREYISDNKVCVNYIEAEDFVPISWDNRRITGGIFRTVTVSNGFYYTLFEKHSSLNDRIHVENLLFRSKDKGSLGDRVPVTELYPELPDFTNYDINIPVFQYFKPDTTNNIESYIPLGISLYANCIDTLKALDVAFDSFAREFILGKKRIIVPSSSIQTVVDTQTGEVTHYFDADDEAFVALKCDDPKDLQITDNTVELRVEEHVKAINALLNILCFQVGLSAGSLSFDAVQGMKTATEVISQESKTARTIKGNKNLLVELFEDFCHALIALGVSLGQLPQKDYELTVGFKDNIIVDENQLIENNINLVNAGLKSKISAIMEIQKCDEETARLELKRIEQENKVVVDDGEHFDPMSGVTETNLENTVESAEKVAGKTLNGAQTQSLLSVIAQYSAGSLSIGQAVNIISVAIGVSKEEAKHIIEDSAE